MKRLLPWLASLVAAALVFPPTYGFGVAVSPVTLIGSWIALRPSGTGSRAIRVGASFNLLIVVVGLGVSTAVWGVNGWITTAWVLLVAVVLFSYTTLPHRERNSKG